MSIVTFQESVLKQALLHPSFAPQDAIKLSYQAVFGAEHLLQEAAPYKAYFDNEYSSVPAKELPLYEQVSAAYSRINLSAWKYHALPADWLFQMFYLTATAPSGGTNADLMQHFDCITQLTMQHLLPFDLPQWQAVRDHYEQMQKDGRFSPVHHSDSYRQAEQPAYRIVHNRYVRLLPVLLSLSSVQTPCVISIDGRAASGKTTLAADLCSILSAGLIHMDDFFLPPALRTPERLATPGGNVHYERFAKEVLPQLRSCDPFCYTCFDCSRMELGEEQVVAASDYRIVEGSYSCHPYFDDYMDLRIFCSVETDEQMKRILKRNGPELAEMFKSRWIPMEEQYFDAYQIVAKADIIL